MERTRTTSAIKRTAHLLELKKYIINMREFLDRAKSYEHLIKEDRLLVLQRVEKRIASLLGRKAFAQFVALQKKEIKS